MTSEPSRQRKRRGLAMTVEERNAFLGVERTCRIGTVRDGVPHVSPVWYAWDGTALWIHSLIRSRRWADLDTNPLASALVDAGEDYGSLRGVELVGPFRAVGPAPYVGPAPETEAAAALFASKYGDGILHPDGRHAWLRMEPDRVVSWDFAKLRRP